MAEMTERERDALLGAALAIQSAAGTLVALLTGEGEDVACPSPDCSIARWENMTTAGSEHRLRCMRCGYEHTEEVSNAEI